MQLFLDKSLKCHFFFILLHLMKTKSDSVENIFSEYLTRTGRRHTQERTVIVHCVKTMSPHFTIDQLAQCIKRTGFHLSLPTIYSTLQLMVDCGLISRQIFGERSASFELCNRNHSHTVCRICSNVVDYSNQQVDEFLDSLRIPQFNIENINISIHGVCSACARKIARKKSKKSSIPKK